MDSNRTAVVDDLERKVLWLSTWMIHHANRIRPNPDGVKVGGHQASSASSATILSTLYFDILRPADRVAVKPHASPVFHAIQYLLGNQSIEKLRDFRGFGGAQSYPSRTKDTDDVDFSTGSVGLGAAVTCFASLVQDYLAAHDWRGPDTREGRMVALVGDAELDEGNIFEALFEGYKHRLRNTWWIIDYNRHSLDGVIREGLHARFAEMFQGLGWDLRILKYGRKLEAAFAEPGGDALRDWIDACPNAVYSALTFRGGAAWRERLGQDLSGEPALLDRIGAMSDTELGALMTNLAGHDRETLREAFASIDHDRPVCFIAYTIKGFGLPLAGHKDNHAGLLTDDQMAELRAAHAIRQGHEWEPMEGVNNPEAVQDFLARVPFDAEGPRRFRAQRIAVPTQLSFRAGREMSTQDGFGRVLNEIARSDDDLAARIITTSPDVTVSTNLGPWVNRRGLYDRDTVADIFREQGIASTQKWSMGPKGQHLELGIAENNLFLALAAMGLSHSLFGQRLLPIGTLYDPFIQRGLDALNYACYQDARFMLVATPSGISLAAEGGAHQSISTPLIGMAQDGLAAFEPAFVDELAVIMGWGFDYMQRDASASEDGGSEGGGQYETSWLRDETGGSVYLRLSTRVIEQPVRSMTDDLKRGIIEGGYWLKPPGPGCEVVIAYAGAIVSEAITAVAMLAEARRGVGLLAVTSADRLTAGWHAAERARRRGDAEAISPAERLMADVPLDAGIVTVIDGHPTTLGWLGGVCGHRVKPLGVEHFGQTGSVSELYRYYGIDADSIADAATSFTRGRPYRRLRVV
ncbi:transketolase [Fodinicurvata sp. EGI_FJ10296]|uniref:transketolase n=1 Tax=Fodinicurvata sp. EGI_FJ10296 TaxID=3231908 RepID=UPI0034515965